MKTASSYRDWTTCHLRPRITASFGSRLALGFVALWWAGSIETVRAQDWDFGDAPAVYPTLLANNGARHAIGSLFMGALVDPEPDGQPTPAADGDDLNPPMAVDDEDGVTFNTAFISGVPGTVTVVSSGPGLLQGWVDFNADGDWADAGEQILLNFPVVAGTNVVPYSVPAFQVSSTGAVTYARFRLASAPNLGDAGAASDGEVEDYVVKLYPLKWLQPPDLTTNGVDVSGEFELADDFLCTQTGPITDIHIWGSFWNDFQGLPTQVLTNMTFVLKIYSDMPTNNPQNPLPYSHPDILLWQTNIVPGQYQAGLCAAVPNPGEWWHTPPQFWQPGADLFCYQFDFYFNRTNAFSQTLSNIYWLSVQGFSPSYQFGWKSTDPTNNWNDDAVWLDTSTGTPTWMELRYGDGHPYANPLPGLSLNLAFAISTEEEEEEGIYDFGDAPDGAQGTGPGDYETRLADNGAYHTIVSGAPYFDDGTQTDQPDGEPDGQPDATATGDDLNGATPDDEDGIVFTAPLIPGQASSVQITVDDGSGGGGAGQAWVDAWIDFNADGDWVDPGEQIQSGWLPQGVNNVAFNVPAGAAIGQTFARFRINSVGALAPTGGPASDGEVEDHSVTIQQEEQLDFGDAPDPVYPTLLANNGARHAISQLFMGALVDAEADGQPNAFATGDDLNGVPDDEDGVVFTTALISGTPSKVQVTASGPGVLQAWIDWNRNGSWADPNEQIIANYPVVAGPNLIQFSVPNTLPSGKTFARFRLCTVSNLTYTGYAPDGEVEDYSVELYPIKYYQQPEQGNNGVDVSLATPLADDFLCTESGPITDIHIWGSFFRDALPAAGAGSMTLVLTFYADAGGFPGTPLWSRTFGPGAYVAGNNCTVTGGEWWHDPALPSWIFPGDTNMYQFDFYITNAPFMQISNTYYWLGVSNAVFTTSYTNGWKTTSPAALRSPACWLDTAGVWHQLMYGGGAGSGPMDLSFALSGAEQAVDLDFGDAPSPYPTQLPNGARHYAVPGFCLGQLEDTEGNGIPHALALGDDLNNLADEDGVVFKLPVLAGTQACVNVTLTGPAGLLDAWVDFNKNGAWDHPTEQIFASQALVSGPNLLCFNVPTNAVLGTNFARFRLSSLGGLSPTGLGSDGEVEDYQLVIQQPVPVTNVMITNIVATNIMVGGNVSNVVLLQWNAQMGVQYQVQSTATFSNTPPFLWNDVGTVLIGPANTYMATNSVTLEQYYRVMVPYVWP